MQALQSQNDLPAVDNHELEKYQKESLDKVVLSTALANVAPYLAFSKVLNIENNAGATTAHRVRTAQKLSKNVIRLDIETEFKMADTLKSNDNIVFTIKNISLTSFEPFVYIAKHDEYQWCFAYVSDTEYLMEKCEGDVTLVLQQIRLAAEQKDMKTLMRYAVIFEEANRIAGSDNDEVSI